MALAPQDTGGPERDTAIRLVTAHRSGDTAAFTEIVRSHYPTLLACARRRLTNPQDAEDAVQEAFLRAYRRLRSFGSEGDWRLGAWLNTILGNVCLDILSRRHPSAPYDESVDRRPDERPDAAELISDTVVLDAIARAIATLPQSQRSAFLLRMVDDRPYDEVAAALGITEDNARARVARARSALQRALSRSDALAGMLTAAPLLLVGSFRSGLRRIFSSNAGNSAHATAATAASNLSTNVTGAANVAATAAEAASTGGGSLGAGMQMLGQLASTPVAQVALAASASGAPRGSAVLGVVASLAAAGSLSVPAAAAVAATAPSAPVQAATPHLVSATGPQSEAPATSPAPARQPAPPPPPTTAVSSTPSPVASTPPAPSWVAVAASAAVDGRAVVKSGPSTTPDTPTAPGATGSAASATPSNTAGSGSAPQPSTSSPATSATPKSTQASSKASSGYTLPIGTCTGVSGFPGVTAPSTLPPLSSDTLVAVMRTSAHGYAATNGSPAFQTTGSMSAMSGTAAPVNVKVGTCLAAGGSILAVDMTGTTGSVVQLVGSLVSTPTAVVSATGAVNLLFRGLVSQIAGTALPGGRLPWNLSSSFVAEVQVQPGNTASIQVVFLQTITATGATGTTATSTATSAGTRTTTPSTVGTGDGATSAASGTSVTVTRVGPTPSGGGPPTATTAPTAST